VRESEALAYVAILQAAFPIGCGGEPTAHLFAQRLQKFDSERVSKAIDLLIDTREDTRWPSYALLLREIKHVKTSRPELDTESQVAITAEDVEHGRRRLAELHALANVRRP
jgi:hypothetical protein